MTEDALQMSEAIFFDKVSYIIYYILKFLKFLYQWVLCKSSLQVKAYGRVLD